MRLRSVVVSESATVTDSRRHDVTIHLRSSNGRKQKKRPDDAGSASLELASPDVPCTPPLELYVLPDGGRLYRENLWS